MAMMQRPCPPQSLPRPPLWETRAHGTSSWLVCAGDPALSPREPAHFRAALKEGEPGGMTHQPRRMQSKDKTSRLRHFSRPSNDPTVVGAVNPIYSW